MKLKVLLLCSIFTLISEDNLPQNNILQSTSNTQNKYSYGLDSLISNIIKEIDKDSVQYWIQSLQDFKTRFALAPNKDSVADWVEMQFIQMGYTDVKLDTFTSYDEYKNVQYTTLQKNIVVTINGSSDTNNVIIIGAHYDSINNMEDAIYNAPGADDNASGMAAILEIARIFKKKNYKPTCTIKLIAFAGEEYCRPNGGQVYAERAYKNNMKILLMINVDMILYLTNNMNNWTVNIIHYPGFEYYRDYAQTISKYFTKLKCIDDRWGGSDSDAFFYNGYPVIFFTEDHISPYMHSSSDIFENYDSADYCAEIIKAICATLIVQAETQHLPKAPYKLTATPDMHKVNLNWIQNSEKNIIGYNIYRTVINDSSTIKLNTVPVKDTFFIDTTPANGIYYYYKVSALDSLLNESVYNFPVKSRSISLDQGILVVDEASDGTGALMKPTDEEVDNFYTSLLTNFNKKDYDIIKEGNISISDLGAFSTVIWAGNDYENLELNTYKDEIKKYLGYGGNLLISSFFPTQSFENIPNPVYPIEFQSGDFIYDVLKIKQTDYKFGTRFSGAISLSQEYPSIFVDTTKIQASYKNHLIDIESIEAAPGGKEIYKYDTNFDSTTQQGKMKGLPVGVEYLGNDYKIITLSFPLYYMNREQAKELVQEIMLNKFNETTDVNKKKEEIIPVDYILYQNFPNPFNPNTTINYVLPERSFVKLKIYDVLGRQLKILVNEVKSSGKYKIEFNASSLPSGIYLYSIEFGNRIISKKMLLLK